MAEAVVELSLVVPCFNEGPRLEALWAAVGAWRDATAQLDGGRSALETVLVDDGSTDDTAERIAGAAAWDPTLRVVRLERNEGKGAALRRGVAATRGAYVVAFDADLAVGLEHLDPLLAALRAGADAAIGSRNVAGARVPEPQGVVRRWLGSGYLRLARGLLDLEVSDVTCGLKGFRGDVARSLYAATRTRRWGIDAEVLALARRRGLTVVEVPVTWSDGRPSAVRLRRDVLGAFRELLAVRRHLANGHDEPRAGPAHD